MGSVLDVNRQMIAVYSKQWRRHHINPANPLDDFSIAILFDWSR